MKHQDNSIAIILSEAGLSPSEQQVYSAGTVELQSSAELIARTKLPRPTVMAALKHLRELGLCEVTRQDGRSFSYQMRPPNMLKPTIAGQIRKLAEVMTRLDEVSSGTDAVTVREANGQEAVQELLELALQCKSRSWRIIAPHNNALRFMSKDYTSYFKQVRRERQIVSETLWEAGRKGTELPLHDILMRKPRFLPPNIGSDIPSLLLAFDDSLLAITGTTQPAAVLVQNPAIVSTFALVFDIAWQSCRESN